MVKCKRLHLCRTSNGYLTDMDSTMTLREYTDKTGKKPDTVYRFSGGGSRILLGHWTRKFRRTYPNRYPVKRPPNVRQRNGQRKRKCCKAKQRFHLLQSSISSLLLYMATASSLLTISPLYFQRQDLLLRSLFLASSTRLLFSAYG